MNQLEQNNPALMKALEKLKKAEDNFELLSKLWNTIWMQNLGS